MNIKNTENGWNKYLREKRKKNLQKIREQIIVICVLGLFISLISMALSPVMFYVGAVFALAFAAGIFSAIFFK